MNKLLFIHLRCLTVIYIILLLLCKPLPINAGDVVSITICERVTKLGTVPLGIKDKFRPQSPEIHSVAVVKNLEKGLKIKGSWVAVNSIPTSNYQIGSKEIQIHQSGEAKFHFAISRPIKGWPLGNYRFELYINNKLISTAPFSIVSDAEPKLSVSFNFGPVQRDKERAWTVLVYMDGDNNLEAFALKDIDEMERSMPEIGVDVIVFVDRAEGFSDLEGNWTDTRIFRICHDRQPGIRSAVLSKPGEQNMGDPSVLQAFISSALRTFPAQRHALILWDHGGGWEGHVIDDKAPNSLQGFDKLTLPELNSAIKSGLNDTGLKKLDLVGFDMCLMAQIETAYELESLADVMVGSEAIEPNDGWPYEAVIPIFNDNSISTQEVGKRIVAVYDDHYRTKQEPITTQSTFDLSRVGETLMALDKVLNKLNGSLDSTWPTLSRTLFFSEAYAARTEVQRGKNALASIDLMDAMKRLKINMRNFPAGPEYKALVKSMDRFVLSSKTSPARRLSTGVAIYAPVAGRSFNPAYRQTRFSKTSQWVPLLDKLHTLQKRDKGTPIIRDLQLVSYANNQIVPTKTARPLSTDGILYTVEGKNLLWLKGMFGERTKDGKGMLIYSRSTVLDANWDKRSKKMASDRVDLMIPEYRDGVNQRIIMYSGYCYAVSNGQDVYYATIDMPLQTGYMSTPIIFTHPSIGTLRGIVFFEPRWWNSTAVVLVVPQKDGTMLYRQVKPPPDAEITTLFEVLTDKGEISYLRGGKMKWGEGLELLLSLYQPGNYEIALTAEAINGRSSNVFFEFPVDEHPILKEDLKRGSKYSQQDLIGNWFYINPDKYRNNHQIIPMGLEINFSQHPQKKGLLISELTKPNDPDFSQKSVVLLDTRRVPHMRMFPVQEEGKTKNYLKSNTSSVYLTALYSTREGSPVMLLQNILNLGIYMAVKRQEDTSGNHSDTIGPSGRMLSPGTLASGLFGVWQSAEDEKIIFQGNQYTYYESNQFVDSGLFQIQDSQLVAQSQYSGEVLVYHFQISENQLFLKDSLGQAYQFFRSK